MDKKTKNRVKGIAIFIVFLAIATSIIDYKNKEGKPQNFNFKPSQQEYRDLKFINKAQVNFAASDVRKAQDEISSIISEKSVKQVRKQNEPSFGAYLFSVPQKQLPQLIERLRSFGVVGSQTEQIDTSLVNIDYDSEIARLASYEKEQADLNAIRFPADSQNRRKEALHSLIHQSRQNLDKLKDAENVLLYIALSPLQKDSNALLIIKIMSLSFFSWLGIFSVGMVIVYFGTRMLMYFLAAIGIKGLNANGVGGGYQYSGYGTYGSKYTGRYSSGAGKRKVKRVYKDKQSTPTSTEDDK
ncbi:MAG: hypothetical protein CVU50_06150 [Candidatus Cloacimonetes bacterium HGW-Cloacimonetes-3]|nr:MAG: hypothetical protein CVU50_06150 [Candidatus Cloacimonetes bacterium HGW-Cloacimonetes-3]